MEPIHLKPIQVTNRLSKLALLAVLIAVVASMHFIPLPGQLGIHFVHRELFFFPLMLSAFWFGLKGGVFSSLLINFVYLLYFVLHRNHQPDLSAIVVPQALVFVVVGLLFGWLVDRQERRRHERDFIKDTFGKYIPEELRDKILSRHIPLDGEFKEVTVLFADLRDFTPLVERNSPQIVVQLINRYFKEMTEAIHLNGGLVLQFIGDEIEAVFGAPLTVEHHPDLAVQAALEMRRRLALLNHELAIEGLDPLSHGIGVHTGKVLAGNIGIPELTSYAMVGNTVNLASRIQGLNKRFKSDILISADTQKALSNPVQVVQEAPVHVKGVEHPVAVCRVL